MWACLLASVPQPDPSNLVWHRAQKAGKEHRIKYNLSILLDKILQYVKKQTCDTQNLAKRWAQLGNKIKKEIKPQYLILYFMAQSLEIYFILSRIFIFLYSWTLRGSELKKDIIIFLI